MRLRPLIPLLALALLAACAQRQMPAAEPVVAAPEPAHTVAGATACIPGEDDGIGGTGCQVD